MPRKALDASRSVLGCFRRRQTKTPYPVWVRGCMVSPVFALKHAPREARVKSTVEYNSRRLYAHDHTYRAHGGIRFILYDIRHDSNFIVKRKALTFSVGACLYGAIVVNYHFVVIQYDLLYKQVYQHLRLFQ